MNVNVEIVRPKKSTTEKVGAFLGYVIGYLLEGWFLMLILGTVSPWHPSYWHSFLVVIAARFLTSRGDYLQWTRGATK